jgi:hypothetical protein
LVVNGDDGDDVDVVCLLEDDAAPIVDVKLISLYKRFAFVSVA